MSRNFAAACFAAAAVFVLPSLASAANPTRFDFTATVSAIPADPGGDLAGSSIGVGDSVTGFYLFDADTGPTSSSEGTRYLGAMTYLSKTTIEGRDFFAFADVPINGGFIEIRVRDASGPDGVPEEYFAEMTDLNVSELEIWDFNLVNATENGAFNGEALPVTPPNPGLFSTREIFFQTVGGSQLVATVNTLTLPEPGAAASLAAIFGVFGVLGRRRAKIA